MNKATIVYGFMIAYDRISTSLVIVFYFIFY